MAAPSDRIKTEYRPLRRAGQRWRRFGADHRGSRNSPGALASGTARSGKRLRKRRADPRDIVISHGREQRQGDGPAADVFGPRKVAVLETHPAIEREEVQRRVMDADADAALLH